MASEAAIFAGVAFWVLSSLVLLLPVRWSLIAFLLLVQFDVSGVGFYSVGSLGMENAIKTVLLPTLLLWRMWPIEPFAPCTRKFRITWLLLTAVAAVAVIWSPYHLSAVKMVGYMYAYSVLFIVFTCAWRRGWINARSLEFIILCCLLLAITQTYFLGNVYGDPEHDSRFTSFSGAATFGPYLLCLFILLVFRKGWDVRLVVASLGACVGLVLSGGRSMFVALLWTLLLASLVIAARGSRRITLRLIAGRIALGLAITASVAMLVREVLPNNRLNEFLSALVSHSDSIEDVGTFAWRLDIYGRAVDELLSRSPSTLLIGTGTSSVANLLLDAGIAKEDVVDPNRSLHDEFLRSLYEWGLPGFLLLLFLVLDVVRLGCKAAFQNNLIQGWAFLAVCAPLLFSLSIENILSDSASPAGVGYNLVLTYMIAVCPMTVGQKKPVALRAKEVTS